MIHYDGWPSKIQPRSSRQVSIFDSQSKLVGLDGVEPSTSRLSGVRSNQTELQAPDDFWFRIADFQLENSEI